MSKLKHDNFAGLVNALAGARDRADNYDFSTLGGELKAGMSRTEGLQEIIIELASAHPRSEEKIVASLRGVLGDEYFNGKDDGEKDTEAKAYLKQIQEEMAKFEKDGTPKEDAALRIAALIGSAYDSKTPYLEVASLDDAKERLKNGKLEDLEVFQQQVLGGKEGLPYEVEDTKGKFTFICPTAEKHTEMQAVLAELIKEKSRLEYHALLTGALMTENGDPIISGFDEKFAKNLATDIIALEEAHGKSPANKTDRESHAKKYADAVANSLEEHRVDIKADSLAAGRSILFEMDSGFGGTGTQPELQAVLEKSVCRQIVEGMGTPPKPEDVPAMMDAVYGALKGKVDIVSMSADDVGGITESLDAVFGAAVKSSAHGKDFGTGEDRSTTFNTIAEEAVSDFQEKAKGIDPLTTKEQKYVDELTLQLGKVCNGLEEGFAGKLARDIAMLQKAAGDIPSDRDSKDEGGKHVPGQEEMAEAVAKKVSLYITRESSSGLDSSYRHRREIAVSVTEDYGLKPGVIKQALRASLAADIVEDIDFKETTVGRITHHNAAAKENREILTDLLADALEKKGIDPFKVSDADRERLTKDLQKSFEATKARHLNAGRVWDDTSIGDTKQKTAEFKAFTDQVVESYHADKVRLTKNAAQAAYGQNNDGALEDDPVAMRAAAAKEAAMEKLKIERERKQLTRNGVPKATMNKSMAVKVGCAAALLCVFGPFGILAAGLLLMGAGAVAYNDKQKKAEYEAKLQDLDSRKIDNDALVKATKGKGGVEREAGLDGNVGTPLSGRNSPTNVAQMAERLDRMEKMFENPEVQAAARSAGLAPPPKGTSHTHTGGTPLGKGTGGVNI